MSEPGRVTVRDKSGRRASIPELSQMLCMTRDRATVRVSDSPGSERWIEADHATVVSLGGWC